MSELKEQDTSETTKSWAEVVRQTMPGVPVVISPIGAGSGMVIREDGLILTNKHVIEDGKVARLRFRSGEYPAVVVKIAEDTDLAMVKTYGKPPELSCTLQTESEESGPGTEVLVIGHPGDYEETVTRGIVSAIRECRFDPHPPQQYLQIDAAINSGNSGGPVINCDCRVVGLATWKRLDHESLGFGIPAKRLQSFIDETLQEIDDGKIEIPTTSEVAAMPFEPAPLQAIRSAIYDCSTCIVTDVKLEDDDPKEMHKWTLKTEHGADINVKFMEPCEVMNGGYLGLCFEAITEATPELLNSAAVLQALLRHNSDTMSAKFTLNEKGSIELVIERYSTALDPEEVNALIYEMIEETNRICNVILHLRERGKVPSTPFCLDDLLSNTT